MTSAANHLNTVGLDRQGGNSNVTPLSVLCPIASVLETEAYAGELAQLRVKASRLSHLVDTLPAGVIILDSCGCVADSNQVAADMLGEPLGSERWIDIIKRSFNPKNDDGHEVSLKDGRRIKLSISALDPHPGQLILMADLTETRLLQDRLAHMKRLSVLGKMVASLAHQVRTPLSAAMLYAANIANESMSPQIRQKFAAKLNSRLGDLEQQVSNMLLFAKSGGQQVVESLSLQQLLTEVRDGAEAMVIRANGSISVSLPEPDILIRGNKSALASAIQNLIHNALEEMPQQAQLLISAQRDPRDPAGVIIAVQDNGPGIGKALGEQIFEPFFTTKQSGTGLGLAVVQAIAQAHQGKLSLDLTVAQGAKFDICLPIYAQAGPQVQLQAQEI